MSGKASWRIGVDIGGTFTDLVMANAATGQLFNEKVLTTSDDPSRAVLAGVGLILKNNKVAPSEVEHVIHGTTLVANFGGCCSISVCRVGGRDLPGIGGGFAGPETDSGGACSGKCGTVKHRYSKNGCDAYFSACSARHLIA